MLRMAYERETIQWIRSEVDRYDKYQQLYGGGEATIGAPSDTTGPRAILCSGVGPSFTVSAFGIVLSEDLGIKDFSIHLHNLLQGRVHSNAKINQVSC